MNTKLLMIFSAAFMGILGISLSFFPHEIIRALGEESSPTMAIIVQLMGALYFGFAIMNWMAKTLLIGGIYARPLSIGNFCHFGIGALALLKLVAGATEVSLYIQALAVIYLVFAVLFGFVFVKSPVKRND